MNNESNHHDYGLQRYEHLLILQNSLSIVFERICIFLTYIKTSYCYPHASIAIRYK